VGILYFFYVPLSLGLEEKQKEKEPPPKNEERCNLVENLTITSENFEEESISCGQHCTSKQSYFHLTTENKEESLGVTLLDQSNDCLIERVIELFYYENFDDMLPCFLTTCRNKLDIDNPMSSNVLKECEVNTIQLSKEDVLDAHGIQQFISFLE